MSPVRAALRNLFSLCRPYRALICNYILPRACGRVAQMIFDISSRPEAAPTLSQPQGPEGGSRLSAANGPSNHLSNTPLRPGLFHHCRPVGAQEHRAFVLSFLGSRLVSGQDFSRSAGCGSRFGESSVSCLLLPISSLLSVPDTSPPDH